MSLDESQLIREEMKKMDQHMSSHPKPIQEQEDTNELENLI